MVAEGSSITYATFLPCTGLSVEAVGAAAAGAELLCEAAEDAGAGVGDALVPPQAVSIEAVMAATIIMLIILLKFLIKRLFLLCLLNNNRNIQVPFGKQYDYFLNLSITFSLFHRFSQMIFIFLVNLSIIMNAFLQITSYTMGFYVY